MKLLRNVKRIIVPGAAAAILALQWRAGWFLGSAVTLAAFCFLGIFGPIALGSEKRRKHEKTRATETALATRMAEFSSEKPADLVEGMMVEGRYALLLRAQLVRNLTVEQRERAHAELDKSMALVPEGGVLMAPGVTHPNEDGSIDCVEIVEPLYLDRYQVTNRQFYRFVLAGGYEQFALWEEDVLPALLEFVDETDQLAPRFWHDGQYPIELADHPVVGISWYEAEAYARWLGKRLPTDPEWLKAASWPVPSSNDFPVQRKYPWGDTLDRGRANVCDSSKHAGTSSITDFTDGVTVGGVHQMIGNVWEWTASDFGKWDADRQWLESNDPPKSLRGGAFDTYLESQASNHFQSGDRRLSRKHNIGIRCALSLSDLQAVERGHQDELCEALVHE